MPELVAPLVRVHRSFLEAMAEFVAEGRGAPDEETVLGWEIRDFGPTWSDVEGFTAFIDMLKGQSSEESSRPPGHVPATTRWWVDGDEYLGRIVVRHRLTPHLLEFGGHIGYDMRPSARRKGHATAMLAAMLPLARDLGIDPALLTCDADNTASRLVIEHNGGVLEDQRGGKRRYWVPTS